MEGQEIKRRQITLRNGLLRLHRYAGLALAAFLIIIGSTGSVIAFFPELDRLLNPDLLAVESQGSPTMDMLILRDKLQAADPTAHIYAIIWPKNAGESMSAYAEGAIESSTGKVLPIGYDQIFANPYTGEVLGSRLWGSLPFERKDVFTFIYFLHYSLVLPEFLGEAFMGMVAIVWALDCLVGFALTLPRRRKVAEADRDASSHRKSFWRRWKPAWMVETRAGANRLVFDWHRASGLWLFPLLLVFAVSGFSFNLPGVYSSVISRISGYTDTDVHPDLEEPLVNPAIKWPDAFALTQRYIAEQADRRGFTINRPHGLYYRRDKGIYVYRVHSSRDLVEYAQTSVSIDATTGALIGVEIPTGDNAGNTFTTWIKALHQAVAFGFPYRIAVCAVGMLVVLLTITGVLVWWRKRTARLISAARGANRQGAGFEAAK